MKSTELLRDPRRKIAIVLRVFLHMGALVPLAVLVWDFTQGQLTANPIRELQLRTGRTILLLLALSLACTPLYNITGLKYIKLFRRPLGLYAFGYACLHLLTFVGLDYGFNLPLLWEDSSEKRYIFAGLATFLILLVLAVTSTKGWFKRLGKNWQRIHLLVYVAGMLAVLHYLWQIKVAFRAPLVYGAVIIILLILRIPAVSRATARAIRKN